MKASTTTRDGVYDVECECGWVSAGWDRKKDADARRAQHHEEHETNEPMPELAVFRAAKEN